MNNLIVQNIRDELFGRFIDFEDHKIFVEFNVGKWCLEISEIDDSAENGYAGITIHQLLHKFDISNDFGLAKLLKQCRYLRLDTN